jgi:dihydrofolate synthase/folylpolyglutamate synthase
VSEATQARVEARLAELQTLHPKLIDLSLDRLRGLLAKLGSPQDRLPPTIHVAGTNGKGSTTAFLRAGLEAAGARVHVYASPHLVRFNERIRLAGTLVDDATLLDALERCERANAGQPITLFEITTAAAFVLFSEHPADALILEVGLGGRFDATNVVENPAACVITPVSIDHVEFLGDSLAKIAFEKAGILKPGAVAVFAPQQREALAVLEREAARRKLRPLVGEEDYHAHAEGGRFVFQDERGLLDLPPPRLVGRHQLVNAATAIATLRALRPDLGPRAFERMMLEVEWPARMQSLQRGAIAALAPMGAEIWLDGGHNEDGGRVLAEAMADLEEKSERPLIMICGMLQTKDSSAFLRAFKGLAQELIAVPVPGQSGRPPLDLVEDARRAGLPALAAPSIEAALDFLCARAWYDPPRILICGSLYLAGEALAFDGTIPT